MDNNVLEIKNKCFGTDGIRGRVGSALINPEFILKVGWAVGMVLRNGKGGKVLIGKDTRISGYLLESVLEAGLSYAGVDTHLLGPMPTPAVAYLTRTLRAQAGIVISASHNRYYDNGIKIFSPQGTKLADDVEAKVEAQLRLPMKMIDSAALGKAKRVIDAQGRYIEFCKSTLGLNNNLSGLKIVIDCSNGATYKVAPAIFSELGADIITINVSPNGFNINEGCGSTNPEVLAKVVLAEQADLGIAFDGDGDRVIMVDNRGEVVNGDELVFILAKHIFTKGNLRGGIVGTVMSNYGLELALRDLGIVFERTQVGDRYVLDALVRNNWLLGGESSGHIVHLGITTTGDGIVSALQVLNTILETGRSLFDLKSEMTKFPQVLVNVEISKPMNPAGNPRIQQAVMAAEKTLGKKGRVLLRASGTEPLIRVMVEGEDAGQIDAIAAELAAVVREVMA